MNTGDTWRLGHRPALDGLRGVAVLMVIADHFGFAPKATGSAGVTLFFTLSGFLITRVIIESRLDGRWSYRGFLAARFVRLFPALALMVSVICLVAVASGVTFDGRAVGALLYLGNFTAPGSMFDHAWSLAVEEQFYLLWPLALPLVVSLKHPVRWIVAAAALSAAARFAIDFDTAYRSLPTNAFALLAGCALAVAAPTLRQIPRLALPLSLIGIGATGWIVGSHIAVPVVVACLAVPAVWAATNEAAAPSPLRFVGRISYAWYLWHYPIALVAAATIPGVAIGIALSLGLAVASTLLMEEPLRRAYRSAQIVRGDVSGVQVQRTTTLVVDEVFDVVRRSEKEIHGRRLDGRVGRAG